MQPLKLEPVKYKSPFVSFDSESGELLIQGMSSAEDAKDMYNKLVIWVQEYAESPAPKTQLILDFVYFNTLSAKSLLKLMEAVIALQDKTDVSIVWRFDSGDDEMEEAGENYSMLLDFEFKMEEKEE